MLFLLFFSFLSKRTSKNTILFCFSNNLPYLCSIIKTLSMKKRLIFIISVFLAFVSCSHQQTEKKEQVIDTIPVMVMQIQKCNRLYTAEAHVHKIITHDTSSIWRVHCSRKTLIFMFLALTARWPFRWMRH